MQTPQELDAKHSDELFPVQRQYIGNKLGSAKGPLRRSKNLGGLKIWALPAEKHATGNNADATRA
jgi:hypothetical protein